MTPELTPDEMRALCEAQRAVGETGDVGAYCEALVTLGLCERHPGDGAPAYMLNDKGRHVIGAMLDQ